MNPIILDFETYYDAKITLKKLNYTEYAHKTTPIVVSTLHNRVLNCTNNIKEHLDTIDWNNTLLVCHNTLFDALILKIHYGIEAAAYGDTLSMARLLYPTMKHDLETLRERFLPHSPFKNHESLANTKGKTWDALSEKERNELLVYCRNDTLITAYLYDLWKEQIPETEQQLIDHTIKLWLRPTLILDRDKAVASIKEEKETTDQQIESFGLSKEVIRSDLKFAEYLRAQNYNPPMQWSNAQKKLVPAFSKTSSEFLMFYAQNPSLQPLLDLKRTVNSNIKEARATRIITASDLHNGQVPVGYNYCGAFTGRFSGANKLNMQNLPRKSLLRDALMAPEEYRLVVCDLAQIEARTLAWLAGEQKILDIFQEHRDLYSEVASKIFGFPVNKKDYPDERFVGKCASLGLGYSMSAPKFQSYIALQGRILDEKFCYKVVESYRTAFPKIPALWKLFQDNMYLLCRNTNDITPIHPFIHFQGTNLILPSGRKINFEGLEYYDHNWRLPNGKKVYGALIVENICQAISRDILAEQILAVHPHYPVIMHTHDELIALVPENKAPIAQQHILDIMTTPPAWAPGLPLNAEADHGKRYGDCK
jgi:DNA polymerase